MAHTQLRFLETIDYLFTAGKAWSLLGTYSAMTLLLGYQRFPFNIQLWIINYLIYHHIIIPVAFAEETAGIWPVDYPNPTARGGDPHKEDWRWDNQPKRIENGFCQAPRPKKMGGRNPELTELKLIVCYYSSNYNSSLTNYFGNSSTH